MTYLEGTGLHIFSLITQASTLVWMLYIVIYSAITALYSVQYESTYVKFNLYEMLQRAIFHS